MSGSTRVYGDVHVTHELMARLGNNVLQMYRVFCTWGGVTSYVPLMYP